MLQSLNFGAQYNLVAEDRSGYGSARLPQKKVAALLQALAEKDQDVLILTYDKDALVQAGVPEAKIISKGEKPIHDNERAEILTEGDLTAFNKEYPAFNAAGLESTYLATLAQNPAAKTFSLLGDNA